MSSACWTLLGLQGFADFPIITGAQLIVVKGKNNKRDQERS